MNQVRIDSPRSGRQNRYMRSTTEIEFNHPVAIALGSETTVARFTGSENSNRAVPQH